MTYKVTYFNYRGAAEPIRFMFAYLKIDYEDIRIPLEQWPALKPTKPFGKLPTLEIGDKVLNQAGPICRFLAKGTDLVGKDDQESLMVDICVDNLRDLYNEFNIYYSCKESIRPKLFEKLINETLPFCIGKLESVVNKNDGYFVNGKLTLADLYFGALIDSFNELSKFNVIEGYPGLQELNNKVLAIPEIKKWVETRPETDPLY